MAQGDNFGLVVPVVPLRNDLDGNVFDNEDEAGGSGSAASALTADGGMDKYSLGDGTRGVHDASSSSAGNGRFVTAGLAAWIAVPAMAVFMTSA